MFSTLFNDNYFIQSDFQYVCRDAFKIICCKCVVYGKGLKGVTRQWKGKYTTERINVQKSIDLVIDNIIQMTNVLLLFSKIQHLMKINLKSRIKQSICMNVGTM